MISFGKYARYRELASLRAPMTKRLSCGHLNCRTSQLFRAIQPLFLLLRPSNLVSIFRVGKIVALKFGKINSVHNQYKYLLRYGLWLSIKMMTY